MTQPSDGPSEDRTKRTDDADVPADQARADSLPDDSPLQPGLAAHTVDPATGESHTGQ